MMIKVKYYFYSLLLSLLFTTSYFAPLSSNLSISNLQILKDIRYILFFLIVSVVIYNLFKNKYNISKYEKKWIAFFCWFISFLNVIGAFYHKNLCMINLYTNYFLLFIIIYKIVGLALSLYFILIRLYPTLSNFLNKYEIIFLKKRNILVKLFIFFLICWLLYYIIYWPGILTPDANESLVQFFGNSQYSWTSKSIELLDESVILNNHHPVLYTLLVGIFVSFGKFINNINIGFALYILFQMISMSFIFSYMIYYMINQKFKDIIIILLILFLAFFPAIPFYMITATKDVLYSGLMIMCTIYIHKFTTSTYFRFKDYLFASFNFMLFILFRNNGIYILIITLLIFLIFCKNKRIDSFKLFTPSIVLYFFIGLVIFPSFSITPGSPREKYSVIFQQLARTISLKEDTWLTNDDQQVILQVLNVENILDLKNKYKPEHADSVKNTYNKYTTKEEWNKFIDIWKKGLIKYPDIYLDSFFSNTYPYYSLYSSHEDFKVYFGSPISKKRNVYNIQNNSFFKKEQSLIKKVTTKLKNTSLTAWMFNMGFFAYLIYFAIVVVMMKKSYKKLLIFLFPALNYLICFLGPVAYYRYGLPHILLSFFLVALAFDDKEEYNIEKIS